MEISFLFNLAKVVMIGSIVSDQMKKALMKCLRQHADLFAWSASDMLVHHFVSEEALSVVLIHETKDG